jgi:hypothetical protein
MYNVLVEGKGIVIGTVLANETTLLKWHNRSSWEALPKGFFQFSPRYRAIFRNVTAHELAKLRLKYDWMHGVKVYVYNLDTKQHL